MMKPKATASGVGVTFLPDSRQTQLVAGDRLLLGALKAGVGIKSVCGGHGKCGSCLVRVESAAEGALSPASGDPMGCRFLQRTIHEGIATRGMGEIR